MLLVGVFIYIAEQVFSASTGRALMQWRYIGPFLFITLVAVIAFSIHAVRVFLGLGAGRSNI